MFHIGGNVREYTNAGGRRRAPPLFSHSDQNVMRKAIDSDGVQNGWAYAKQECIQTGSWDLGSADRNMVWLFHGQRLSRGLQEALIPLVGLGLVIVMK